MDDGELGLVPTIELLALHAHILSELRTRGVLRTANSPVADYAEFLVCRALVDARPKLRKGL